METSIPPCSLQIRYALSSLLILSIHGRYGNIRYSVSTLHYTRTCISTCITSRPYHCEYPRLLCGRCKLKNSGLNASGGRFPSLPARLNSTFLYRTTHLLLTQVMHFLATFRGALYLYAIYMGRDR